MHCTTSFRYIRQVLLVAFDVALYHRMSIDRLLELLFKACALFALALNVSLGAAKSQLKFFVGRLFLQQFILQHRPLTQEVSALGFLQHFIFSSSTGHRGP